MCQSQSKPCKAPPQATIAMAIALASASASITASAQSGSSFLATQADTGFYVVGALGRSSEQVDVGAAADTTAHELRGNALGLQLAAGYRPLPAWSTEASYVRLGRASSGGSDSSMDGLMLSALGYLPTPLLTLYGRAGLFDARLYGRYDGPAVAQPLLIHHRDTNLAFGIGLSTRFRSNLNLRLESQGFQITHAGNTSLLSLAFVWSFL